MPRRQPVGIDLGTTYSAVATLDANGRSVMIRNAEGEVLTPSVVLLDADEVVVGKFAKRAVATQPDRVAECVKRDMGRPLFSRTVAGRQMPPEVLQAFILKKLRHDAGPELGTAGVVITVPAYFDEPRRKATADAAEMAGLDVLDIVNEPTAAALAFGEQLGYLSPRGEFREPITVLVYDLGGGTFDVTLISLAPGEFRTLATDGDVELGGRDFDERLAAHIATEFRQRSGFDLRQEPAAWNSLMALVEQTKHTLSSRERAVMHVEHGGKSAEVPVVREQFQQLTEDLLERTAFTTRQVIAAAGVQFSDISRILLVGGSTRMPMVSGMLKHLTGMTPDISLNPDEAVARGAAIYAGYLLAQQNDVGTPPAMFKVTDVNSHSLGIQGIDQATGIKENVIVIRRNTSLPAKATERFATQTAGQRSIVVQVLEGESTQAHLCSRIGRSVLRDLPPGLPQGSPIDVTFEYGINGRLNVRAGVPGSNHGLVIELERERGLDDQRLHRWKQILAGNEDGEMDLAKMLAEALQLTPQSDPASATAPVLGNVEPSQPAATTAMPLPAQERPIQAGKFDSPQTSTASLPLAGVGTPGGTAAWKMPVESAAESAHQEVSQRADRVVTSPGKKRGQRRFRTLLNLVGHVVASTIGLLLGYIILCKIRPEADFLGWFK
ncbi:MAG: Hsp70 family protein [Planctomycetes bacterium]|nr:Hsp70 family protein [Planctomycetota bacterium]